MTAVARQYRTKLLHPQREHRDAAAEDVDERAGHEAAAAADLRHPQRHRHRRDAEPSTYVVAPSVATAFASTSEYPTRPFIVMSPSALVSSSAWQHASRKTLRYERGPTARRL
jgi:hypothetical protein